MWEIRGYNVAPVKLSILQRLLRTTDPWLLRTERRTVWADSSCWICSRCWQTGKQRKEASPKEAAFVRLKRCEICSNVRWASWVCAYQRQWEAARGHGDHRLSELGIEHHFGRLRSQSSTAQLSTRGYWQSSARDMLKRARRTKPAAATRCAAGGCPAFDSGWILLLLWASLQVISASCCFLRRRHTRKPWRFIRSLVQRQGVPEGRPSAWGWRRTWSGFCPKWPSQGDWGQGISWTDASGCIIARRFARDRGWSQCPGDWTQVSARCWHLAWSDECEVVQPWRRWRASAVSQQGNMFNRHGKKSAPRFVGFGLWGFWVRSLWQHLALIDVSSSLGRRMWSKLHPRPKDEQKTLSRFELVPVPRLCAGSL